MSLDPKQVFIDNLRKLFAEFRPDTPADRQYCELLKSVQAFLERVVVNPTIEDFLLGQRLLDQLSELPQKELSPPNLGRSRANIASISAATKRTHYAAYMAGKYSNAKMDGIYKAWMHNAAADAAISVHDLLSNWLRTQVSNHGRCDDELTSLTELFLEASVCDSRRFLDFASSAYPGSVLTTYNTAKLELVAGENSVAKKSAIDALFHISNATIEDHPIELKWRKNICLTFVEDDQMQNAIRTHGEYSVAELGRHLMKVKDEAELMEGKIIDRQIRASKMTKAALATTFTGLVILALASSGHLHLTESGTLINQGIDAINHEMNASAAHGGGRYQQTSIRIDSLLAMAHGGG